MQHDPPTGDKLTIPRPRIGWLWIAILVALAIGAAGRFLPRLPELASQLSTSQPTIGGPFTLTDGHGQRVTEAVLAGKPYAVFFGFTHCPDFCPTTLQDMTGWLSALGPDADKVRMVFVSVDPERDTPTVVGDYLKSFDPRILGLTGSESEIAQVLKAYRVYAHKGEVKNGGYDMDHTAAIYLMDRAGDLKTLIGPGERNNGVLAKLKDLISGG